MSQNQEVMNIVKKKKKDLIKKKNYLKRSGKII